MTAAERILLLLVADLALAKDGAATLQHIDGLKLRIKQARAAVDAEAYVVANGLPDA
jgi:hypothetical protein